MGLEDLTELLIFRGIYSIITCTIFFIIGIKIALTYIRYRRSEILTVGLTLILFGTEWLGTSIRFIFFIFFDYTFKTL